MVVHAQSKGIMIIIYTHLISSSFLQRHKWNLIMPLFIVLFIHHQTQKIHLKIHCFWDNPLLLSREFCNTNYHTNSHGSLLSLHYIKKKKKIQCIFLMNIAKGKRTIPLDAPNFVCFLLHLKRKVDSWMSGETFGKSNIFCKNIH